MRITHRAGPDSLRFGQIGPIRPALSNPAYNYLSSSNLYMGSFGTKEMESSYCTQSLVGKGEVVNETGKSLDKGVVFTSTHEELVFWIDDYMCSLCGCELPPSFVHERQEHSDYHLAEMLQKEEATNDSILAQKERPAPQPSRAIGSARKKQKSSSKDSRHIPIDLFFERSKKLKGSQQDYGYIQG
ncbi:hypothetical protein Taro_036122 [Colocasia esculenta]|uniref:UBZ3-type domain-containing protein n=1 Tax=Colocasia esculenta TaxID=4460 RepID=A0A843VWI2_COLES|nr:hypothetical protein [Colocasia esculenta]